MQIEFTTPPKPRQPRGNYDAFLGAIRRSADWVSVAVEEIGGNDTKQKQSTILLAAKVRKFRVQTSVQRGRLYARLIPGAAKTTPNDNPSLERR
jgi:hypothetical protein